MKVYLDYPVKVTFETDQEFPARLAASDFRDCEFRTKALHLFLETRPELLEGVPHEISDFVVEAVLKARDGERWLVGS